MITPRLISKCYKLCSPNWFGFPQRKNIIFLYTGQFFMFLGVLVRHGQAAHCVCNFMNTFIFRKARAENCLLHFFITQFSEKSSKISLKSRKCWVFEKIWLFKIFRENKMFRFFTSEMLKSHMFSKTDFSKN